MWAGADRLALNQIGMIRSANGSSVLAKALFALRIAAMPGVLQKQRELSVPVALK